MKRALCAAALLALAGCAQQDAALLVTFSWTARIPTDADTLTVDVFDGAAVIDHARYPLTRDTKVPATLTLVQSGTAHPHVKINAQLTLQGQAVYLGTAQADFASGRTVPITVTLVPPG